MDRDDALAGGEDENGSSHLYCSRAVLAGYTMAVRLDGGNTASQLYLDADKLSSARKSLISPRG